MTGWASVVVVCIGVTINVQAQTQSNPLGHEQKVKNYLPHMTWPEVRDLPTRTDMVIMPVASLEEHGHQGPLGTDFLNGLKEMTATGVWSTLDVRTATAERGREDTEAWVSAALSFIERWKQLRPVAAK